MHSLLRARARTLPAIAAIAALAAAPLLIAAPASAADPLPELVINEVDPANDWIEFVNAGDASLDISGLVVKDDDDEHVLTISEGQVLAAGEYFTIDTNVGDEGFGLGKADVARIFTPDGTTLIDSYEWATQPATSWGRCVDTTGDFTVTVATTKGDENACTIDPADAVAINEIEASGGTPGDWVELVNTASVTADLSGLRLLDSDDTHVYEIPSGTLLDAGARIVLEESDFGFGLGGADSVRLQEHDGTLIDEYAWTAHAATTLGRCPDGVGSFAETAEATKGSANVCAPPAASDTLVINEVESNGDDTDWVEVMNTGTASIDLTGYRFLDGDDSHTAFALPAGSLVAPGELFVIDQVSGSNPVGFDFGLGGADSVRLFAPDGVTLVASYAWQEHSAVTFGRCPDGTGEMATTTVSTKGTPNNCALPVKINEIESQPSAGEDWVELVNVGGSQVDAAGLIIRDDDDTHTYTVPAGTTIAAGGFLVVDTLGFGLGGADSVRLFDADALLDSHSWTSHASTTHGRCPDPAGDFDVTAGETKGTQNLCAGVVLTEPWLGDDSVRVLDDEATFAGDLSGVDYEPSGSSALGTLWAVQNGDGLLYRIDADGAGTTADWAPAAGWDAGKTLRYPNGTGTVDAEGVTVVADDSANGIYVSSERDNAASSVSRPAVLRYDEPSTGAELIATDEWNLAADFPGLGANAGLEGITWIPDAFLTGGGFVDGVTGSVYDPADYPGHGDGLFFVGVEGTASVYAYALMADGSFARIATLGTTFSLVADVQFDADRGGLWVVCDEACEGRTALYELDADTGAFAAARVFERPAGMANVANEGFAVADDAACVAGAKPTFYADDADTDGFSLRSGSVPCETTGGPTDPTDPTDPTPTPEPTPPASGGDGGNGGDGVVTPIPGDQLTDDNRGDVDAPADVVPGETITVFVGTQYAGQTVTVWIYSTPVLLGTTVVAADGTVTVTLPAGIDPGAHRIAVLDANGELIGWTDVTVGELAATGTDQGSVLGLVIGGLAMAGAGVALTMRRRVREDAAA